MVREPTDREAMAKEYDAIHNRLFLLQILVLGLLLAVYQFSGASAALANGLAWRFGENMWWATNAVYTLVSVFGFAAFMSPFGFYGDYVLEQHYGLSNETVGDWLFDFFKSLVIDLVIATILFSVIYAFLRWFPELWWLSASAFYILFAVVLSTIAPVVIMPLFHKFVPLEEGDLSIAVNRMMREAGIEVVGVFKWGLEGKTTTANAAFAGFGKTKRIVLGDTLLSGYSQEEILAILAHEVGHYKNRDSLRLMLTGSLLATAGFYIAHYCLLALTGFFDIPHIYDIGAAPVFIFCLFVFSLVSMPIANLHSRRREFAADAYAVATMGSPDALVSAFEKLADQNLSNKEPARWVELLLHSHPSMARRIERARQN
ncbi:M48 family metallopeptidase [Pontiella sp.]|uniref:M48 family metallopeptidase n=1 Tax=Pontiella sp. TaxID=2837462 RepID=UPI00356A99BD